MQLTISALGELTGMQLLLSNKTNSSENPSSQLPGATGSPAFLLQCRL